MPEPPEIYESPEELDSPDKIDVSDAIKDNDASESYIVIGEPHKYAQFWRLQETDYDCGITSQEGAIEACGKYMSTEEIRLIGKQIDAYEENGTDANKIGYAFENAELGLNYYERAELDPYDLENFEPYDVMDAEKHLRTQLEHNKAVICVVDTQHLWEEGEPGGHALWVTGAEYDEQGILTKVYCNDSGREDGEAIAYYGSEFRDAWMEYGFRTASTEQPMRLNEDDKHST